MRWLAVAIALFGALLWWWLHDEDGASRQSRDRPEDAPSYASTERPQADREGPEEPTRRKPAAEDRSESTGSREDEPAASYIPIRCRDERGTPLAGLTIAVGRRNQLRAGGLYASGTDAHGCTMIAWPGKAGTSLRVHVYDAKRPGFEARTVATTRRSAEGAPLDLVLAQPVDCIVRVLDLDGRPIEKATLTIDPVIPEGGLISAVPGGWKLETDARGQCVVSAQRGAPYRLTAAAKGFAEDYEWEWRPPEDGRATVFELGYTVAAEGTIRGVGADSTVELDGPSNQKGTTDRAGNFFVGDLMPGEYRMIVTDRAGRVRAIRSVVIVEDTKLDPIETQPVVERRIEVLDANQVPAADAWVRLDPGLGTHTANEAGQIRFEAATVNGLWLIVGAPKCGRRWIPIVRLASPVVLPAECAVKVKLILEDPRPEYFFLEYGPPGRPPVRKFLEVGGDEPMLEVPLAGLPPGPLEVDLMGETKRLQLRPGKPAEVTFHVGR